MEVDYLIVGGGLAGATLACRLLQKQRSFVLVDPYQTESASSVSAGICNPVVFRRLNLSWMADTLMNEATAFYSQLESNLSTPLLDERSIVRVFSSEDEKAFWKAKINEVHLHHRIALAEQLPAAEMLHANRGGGLVKGVLQVHIAHLFNALRERLILENRLITQPFDYTKLTISEESVSWQGIEAKRLVFCEGHGVSNNPFFNWLPLKPVKGEALLLTINELPDKHLYSKKITLCPLGNATWWAGATYDWEDLSLNTTSEARNTLLEQLRNLIQLPFQVIDHKAGIRPAAADRRPLLGQHPDHQSLYVFNGFGTKGCMIAPYFSKCLLDFMETKTPLAKEVTIARYQHLYQGG